MTMIGEKLLLLAILAIVAIYLVLTSMPEAMCAMGFHDWVPFSVQDRHYRRCRRKPCSRREVRRLGHWLKDYGE